MSDLSPLLALPLLQPAQAQKHVTHNEALALLDALVQLVVEDFDAATPPAAPLEGQVWALGAAPTAAWVGHAGTLATWRSGAWQFIAPAEGWRAWGKLSAELRVLQSGAWINLLASVSLQNLSGLGIGTTSDATNRLALASAASLFNHAGAGHQVKINKASTADTASLLFQSNWSGRAEIGLTGSDTLALKVSADGSSFATALQAAPATGRVTLPAGADIANTMTLTGQATSPISPPEGSLWHNSTTGLLRARIGGATRTLAARDLPWLNPVSGDYAVTCTGTGGGGTTASAATANRMDIFPFIPRGDILLDGLALNVTVAATGALARIVVYSADADGRPDQLMQETSDIDLSPTGAKVATVTPFTLYGGQTYWIGVRLSANGTISSWNTSASPDLNGGSISTAQRKILRRTLAFSTPAPTSWGYSSSETSSGLAPAIWIRAA